MRSHGPGEQKAYAAEEDDALSYLLYLPPRIEAEIERRWPVLCFLHGIGEAAVASDGAPQSMCSLMRHGAPPWHAQINSPLIRDFIVIAPQLPQRRSWEERDLRALARILERIYSLHRADRERTYLTGFSIGARAVFDFEAWGGWGGQWAALWPVDDANEQPRLSCTAQRIWLHFGTWRARPQSCSAQHLRLQEATAFSGSSPSDRRLFTDYRQYGYDHVGTCLAAYADWRVYRWLLEGRALHSPASSSGSRQRAPGS
jgi:predicted peptidase